MATCFGWTWEYIDEFVTVPRLEEITSAWRKTPPLHRAVAAIAQFFGMTGDSAPSAALEADLADEGEGLQALMTAGIGFAPGLIT